MDPTTKFQNALPFALLGVSPALSALHVTRIRRSSSNLLPTDACAKCGTLLRYGGSTTRIVRKAKTSRTRYLQSKCSHCGWTNQKPINSGNEYMFSKRERTVTPKQPLPTPATSKEIELPLSSKTEKSVSAHVPAKTLPETSDSQNAASKSKSRPKKKTGLQEMLARNRLKEEKEKQAGQKSSNLAAFLDGL
ncbi:hypothetical protein K435DRAFT_12752 [Dendrothele bispora CBS 962.96]|uniref:Rpr2-domain-containing protein n=1 Tax=Dendrothele bispora (strain CBS 962.96) TaxID=1314807 RepID=A0A4S8MYG6_DENBC|nr:hypothetical protein K435DRAFT_12752 [Dendrothele bispora CBS 962.96]